MNDVNYFAARGKLRFVPSDDLDVLVTASVVHDTSSARGVQDLLRGDRNVHNQLYPYQKFDQQTVSL